MSTEVSENLGAAGGTADIHNGQNMLDKRPTTCYRVSDSHLRPRKPECSEAE